MCACHHGTVKRSAIKLHGNLFFSCYKSVNGHKRHGKASSYIFATYLSESSKQLGVKVKKVVVPVYVKKAYRGSGDIYPLILELGECSRSVTATLPPRNKPGTHEQETVRGFIAGLGVLKTGGRGELLFLLGFESWIVQAVA